MNDERLQHYEAVLDNCIDAVLSGTADIDTCLQRFPSYAAELRRDLSLILLASSFDAPAMPEEAVDALEARLQAEFRARYRSQQQNRVILFNRLALPMSKLAAGLILAFMVMFTSGAGVVAASAEALPGDTLYGVKRLWESIILFFANLIGHLEEAYIQIAQTRLDEVVQLNALGRLSQDAIDELLATTEDLVLLVNGDNVLIDAFLEEAETVLSYQAQQDSAHDYGALLKLIVDNRPQQTTMPPAGTQPSDTLHPAAATATLSPPSPTATATATATPVATMTPTVTPTATATRTPTPTYTPTFTVTPTWTWTPSVTPTATWTPLPLPGGTKPPSGVVPQTATPQPRGGQPTATPTSPAYATQVREWILMTQTAVFATQTAVAGTEEPQP